MDMAGPPSVTPSRGPSVMDRIRDLYSPRRDEQATDESATELIRRPFRRLQSPWGLLRSREVETADLLLPPQSVESPIADSLPESSLSVGPAPDAELPAPELLDMLITDFERRTSNWPRDATGTPANPARWRRLQTDLRLLHLIADHSALANAAIDGLPGEEREFWQSLTMAMSIYRDDSDDTVTNNERYLAAAEQLRTAVRQLQSLCPLTINRIAFCSRINSFGSVDSFPTTDFSPGQPVLIYAEIDNFKSQRSKMGTYQSRFSAQIDVLRNDDTEPVESIEVGELLDESTSPRTDYFQSYELTIPQLAPGRYTLRLTIQDELGSQHAISTLPFHIR